MTLYALILFLHIAGALFLFAGLTVQWIAFSSLRRSTTVAQAGQWTRLAVFATRLYGPAIGVIILSGAYLGSVMKAWDQAWLPGAFLALLLVGAIGVGISDPRVRALRKRLAAGNPGSTDGLEGIHDPVLLTSVRIRAALVLGVLLLMVTKVNLLPTVVVLLSALVVGLAAAAFSWKLGRKATSTV